MAMLSIVNWCAWWKKTKKHISEPWLEGTSFAWQNHRSHSFTLLLR